jgi:hypothetical protein
LRRGEQNQGIPPGSPGVTDPASGIQDLDLLAALNQLIAHRKAGLAAANDEYVE